LVTSWQPGWSEQVVGLSDAQAVGVPVQVVAAPDHPEQSNCSLQVVWSVMEPHGVSVPVHGVEVLDQ
jgi:hypothetical protein